MHDPRCDRLLRRGRPGQLFRRQQPGEFPQVSSRPASPPGRIGRETADQNLRRRLGTSDIRVSVVQCVAGSP
jgi:hypothetical protein